MRRKFDQYVNLRPAYLFDGVPSPLRDKAPGSIDMLVYRENTEGEYAPIGGRLYDGHAAEIAIQTAVFTRRGCERIMRAAFEAARKRKRRDVASPSRTPWCYGMVAVGRRRQVGRQGLSRRADARRCWSTPRRWTSCASRKSFDVVVASNLFGDILTDLSAIVTGSMGLAVQRQHQSGANVPEHVRAGARLAPDIAGKGIANPLAAILSAALMLDHLNEARAADAVRTAVKIVLKEKRALSPDLGGKAKTTEVGDAVVGAI